MAGACDKMAARGEVGMTRGQRRMHLGFWLVVGPMLLVGVVVLLALRAPGVGP